LPQGLPKKIQFQMLLANLPLEFSYALSGWLDLMTNGPQEGGDLARDCRWSSTAPITAGTIAQ